MLQSVGKLAAGKDLEKLQNSGLNNENVHSLYAYLAPGNSRAICPGQ